MVDLGQKRWTLVHLFYCIIFNKTIFSDYKGIAGFKDKNTIQKIEWFFYAQNLLQIKICIFSSTN